MATKTKTPAQKAAATRAKNKAAKLAADAAAAAAKAAAEAAADAVDSDDDEEDAADVALQLVQRTQTLCEGSDAKTTVGMLWRLVPRQEPEYLGQIPVFDLLEGPMDVVRERHGGGRYRLRFATGGIFIPGTNIFTIGGNPKSPDAEEPKKGSIEELLELIKNGKGGNDNAVLVEVLKQNGELARAMVTAQPAAAPTTNTAEILQSLSPLLVLIVEGVLSKNTTPDPLTQMRDMAGIMKDMREDSEPGIGGIAKQVIPSLTKLVDATVGAGGVPSEQPAPAPEPAPSPGAAVVPTTEPQAPPANRPAWYAYLAPMMPQFLTWATTGSDAQTCGDFVADQLTDEQIPPIHEQLVRAEFMAELQAMFPAVVAHAQWFDNFLGAIAWSIDPNAEPEKPAEPTPAPATTSPSAAGEIIIE